MLVGVYRGCIGVERCLSRSRDGARAPLRRRALAACRCALRSAAASWTVRRVDKHYYDFGGKDNDLLRTFLDFVDFEVKATPGYEATAQQLRRNMERRVVNPDERRVLA